MSTNLPTIFIAKPEPRVLSSVFDAELLEQLGRLGKVVIHSSESSLSSAQIADTLKEATIVIGQIDLPRQTLETMPRLRAILNIEGNFQQNIDYAYCFEKGIHVAVASQVFAAPVAELALAMAIGLARGMVASHEAFRSDTETWGMPAAAEQCFTLYGARVGIVGLGDLGVALRRLLVPFQCQVKAYDPWQTPIRIREHGCEPAELDDVLANPVVFVFAGATADNQGFLDAARLERIPHGGVLLMMSRANVVDFDALAGMVATGRLRAGIDVFPTEPLAAGDALRRSPNCILSSHRAGSLPAVFRRMGQMVVEDVDLLLRGLPPQNCKRAERETVAKMRSKPIDLAMQATAAG